MERPRITLVTPSFNQAPFLERMIRSVHSQEGDFDLEHLVVDGGSSDATLEVLRRFQDRLRWVSEPDRGQVHAINKGLRQATGEIVGWLNSDDLLLPGTLAKVCAALQGNRQAVWVHGKCIIVDARDVPIRRWIAAYKNWCCKRYSYSRLLTENFISQMTVFWRRSALEKVGYLDEGLKLAFDYDLWLRLGRLGDPLFIPEPLACFRWYETSKSGSGYEAQFREDYLVAQRYASDRRWIRLRKLLKTVGILAAYKTMALLRTAAPGQAR